MSELNSITALVGADLDTNRKPLRVPDYSGRAALAAKVERAVAKGVKVRRLTHSCGHEQGHAIEDGPWARMTYRSLRSQPCGACAPAEEAE